MTDAKIKCPHCGYHTTSIVNCDYGFGHGTEFECGSNSCGRRFVNMSDPRTPAEALRRAAWKVFGAAAFSLRCHDSAYAEDRVSDEEKYAAECVAEQRIGYTLLVEADRLDALPVAELSEERETIARLTKERHTFVEVLFDEMEKLEKRIDECDSLRAQLADVMQERDEARKQLGEALINSEERLAHANQLQADIEEEQRGRLLLRERHGARDDETFGMFIERAIKERPAVGTTHPVAVADADQRAHPEARWVGVGGYIGMFTRLPNRAPEAVNVSRLTPTVISPACNCDELIAARETLARLTSERDALTARLQSEHETRWWATYNAALTGVLAHSGNAPPLTGSPHKEATHYADTAHGPRGSK